MSLYSKSAAALAGVLLSAAMQYPQDCYCKPGNCQSVPCAQLHHDGRYWVWRPHGLPFWGKAQVLPSPDGQCHVCIYESAQEENGLCVFIPDATS